MDAGARGWQHSLLLHGYGKEAGMVLQDGHNMDVGALLQHDHTKARGSVILNQKLKERLVEDLTPHDFIGAAKQEREVVSGERVLTAPASYFVAIFTNKFHAFFTGTEGVKGRQWSNMIQRF
jgi:hypothetical protein